MPRRDLLALTPDDLATLTNLGTVKRARKELETAEISWEVIDDPVGDLVVVWSDGVTCRFPAGRSIQGAVCSSGLAGISRHVVRSVLAYQKLYAANGQVQQVESAGPQELSPAQPGNGVWDPGTISDEDLRKHFRNAAVAQAWKRFEQGVLVELTRGAKPLARFPDECCTLRFMVPQDLRYVSGDCAESQLSTWVAIAVWAFRELPADRLTGLLNLQPGILPIPAVALESLDRLLSDFIRMGLGGLSEVLTGQLVRLEESLRSEGLIWPAELIAELTEQIGMYQRHDARFEPQQVVWILGELIARRRAISNGIVAVPQQLIRGSKSDRPTEIAGGRLLGLGTGVRIHKRHTVIRAYLQDLDSGSVSVVERAFPDPEAKSGLPPRDFDELASTVLMRGVALSGIASSQLLLRSGKRTPSGLLILPRTTGSMTVHPQSFQWEQLKPPLAAEDFAQLSGWLQALPPSYLRPRRRVDNLHVVAIEQVDEVQFDVHQQKLTARIRDARGTHATLEHPFFARGLAGFNGLAAILEQRGHQVRFVCGHVSSSPRSLVIRPVAIILDDGERRIVIQPWLPSDVGGLADTAKPAMDVGSLAAKETRNSPVEEFQLELGRALTELALTGISGCESRSWSELHRRALQLGFVRLNQPLAELASQLDCRAGSLHWDAQGAIHRAQQLLLLHRIAHG